MAARRSTASTSATEPKWNANQIAAAINNQLFKRSVLMVPNCYWTGHEADLLVITKDLRIIDVEIKISRSDLKADQAKDKWYHSRPWSRRHEAKIPREWPDKVWKHYYVMPASIWTESLYASIPKVSGIILLRDPRPEYNAPVTLRLIRKAKPCREAKPICPQDAVDLARLASLRMWAAINRST